MGGYYFAAANLGANPRPESFSSRDIPFQVALPIESQTEVLHENHPFHRNRKSDQRDVPQENRGRVSRVGVEKLSPEA